MQKVHNLRRASHLGIIAIALRESVGPTVNFCEYAAINFGKPKTPGQWIAHIAGAIPALSRRGEVEWFCFAI
jgi:hypothetical protein